MQYLTFHRHRHPVNLKNINYTNGKTNIKTTSMTKNTYYVICNKNLRTKPWSSRLAATEGSNATVDASSPFMVTIGQRFPNQSVAVNSSTKVCICIKKSTKVPSVK